MMSTRFFRIVSVLIIAAVFLTACGGAAVAEEKTPLRIAWSLYSGYYPLVIAQQQGLFEKHNVKVELALLPAYKDTLPQLASGFADGATLVLGDVLLEDVGNSSSIVLLLDFSNGADQIIATPEVMASKDLKGKRIGVTAGSFGDLFAREMLKKYNVSPSDVQFVEVPPEAVASSIPSIIDVGHTYDPFVSQARAKGNGVLFTSADAPNLIVDTIAFTNTALEDRPEDIRNFINAWFEAVEYWQNNPEQGNAIIAAATGQNASDVSFEGLKFFNRNENIAAFQPGNDNTSVVFTAQTYLDFLISSGLVTKPLDVNAILNPSYLQ